MVVYVAKNKINGKCYIGKTNRSLEIRKKEHLNEALCKNSSRYFHKAIRKYGEESFEWSVLLRCETQQQLNEAEVHLIKEHNTIETGYNVTNGNEFTTKPSPRYGDKNSFYGKHHTDEVKQRLRELHKGLHQGEKNPMYGKGYLFVGELNAFYGKHHTEETKKIISDTNSLYWSVTNLADNSQFIIKSLRKFCQEQNLNYSSVKGSVRNNREYKGYKFTKVSSALYSLVYRRYS